MLRWCFGSWVSQVIGNSLNILSFVVLGCGTSSPKCCVVVVVVVLCHNSE